jgi:RHS repeat-associated protein
MFTNSTTYDALNRPLTVTTPDNSVYHPTFNEANLLDKVDLKLRGAAASTPFVTNIDYDAKGQRKLIAYGNGAQTTYEYDRLTFRLIHLKTRRPAGLNGLAPIFADPTVLQDLRYTYDPAGNIIRIEDAALSTVHHNGKHEPVCSYTYDAIYRLMEASGREHIGQTVHDFEPPEGDRRDYPFTGHRAHPNDLQALRTYTERYEYDAVGNFQFMRHSANGGSWTRRYEYEEESLTEPGKQSNRVTRTTVGNGLNHFEKYTYGDAQGNDSQGCMTAINTMKMVWDFEDQLQQVDLGGGGKAYYVYDAAGQRVRKVIETQNGTSKQERIYLGGFEAYRKYENNGDTVKLERETLHIMDDKQRIVLVETKSFDNGNAINSPVPIQRYQFANHLGSAILELDEDGALLSYEEYHPYGTTAYQVTVSGAEVSLRRYRYTGKERDEESGFYYHGARYYAPWLGRWISCDSAGVGVSPNLYEYVRGNPVRYVDPSGLQEQPGVLSKIWTWLNTPISKDLEDAKQFNQALTDAIQEEALASGSFRDILIMSIVMNYNVETQGKTPNTPLAIALAAAGTAANARTSTGNTPNKTPASAARATPAQTTPLPAAGASPTRASLPPPSPSPKPSAPKPTVPITTPSVPNRPYQEPGKRDEYPPEFPHEYEKPAAPVTPPTQPAIVPDPAVPTPSHPTPFPDPGRRRIDPLPYKESPGPQKPKPFEIHPRFRKPPTPATPSPLPAAPIAPVPPPSTPTVPEVPPSKPGFPKPVK